MPQFDEWWQIIKKISLEVPNLFTESSIELITLKFLIKVATIKIRVDMVNKK